MHNIITVNTLFTHTVTVNSNITTMNKLLTHGVIILHNIITVNAFLTHRVAVTHKVSTKQFTAAALKSQPNRTTNLQAPQVRGDPVIVRQVVS